MIHDAIDFKNSSNALLAAGATFVGAPVIVLNYSSIAVSIYASHASAVDGLRIEQSTDGENWDFADVFSVPADNGQTYTISPHCLYYRINYTNGTTQQTAFRLQCALKGSEMTESNRRIVPVQVHSPLTAFGELETASPRNRFDCEFIYDKQPLLMDDISTGTGAATHNVNSRDIQLTIAAEGDAAGMRSHAWIPYTPGSGQKAEITGTLNEQNIAGGTGSVFLRSNVTGTVVETEIEQSAWLAASDLDWATSQILAIPFQSLKVGTVFYYLVRNGAPVLIAKLDNDNIRATGYWQYASLPQYWKLYTSAGQTIMEMGYGDELNGVGLRYKLPAIDTTATMRAICTTVKSQGGELLENMPGFPFVAKNTTGVAVATAEVPLLSIRTAALFGGLTNRSLIIPTGIEIETDNPLYYQIRYRPTLTGASFEAIDATHSALEQDTAATAVSGGVVVGGGFASAGRNTPSQISTLLGRVIMSLGSLAPDVLTVTAVRTGSQSATVRAIIKGKEIR